MKKTGQKKLLDDLSGSEYKYGFSTDVETDIFPKGLNEEIVRAISARKEEPAWLLEFRLKAYRK
ncbi:MAG: Fe-S cluster assembly protein SufB, partial [Paludibacteraceae bacterium]|nr:Fe-S cluster assembly protein SufB [Paludibacteraceae bacterium]